MTPEQLRSRIAARFGQGAVSDASHGTVTVDVVDELADGFAIMAHLYSVADRHHLLLRTRVARDAPRLSTATSLYGGAAGAERETAALFGIRFEGHPDPSPLLLPDCLRRPPPR